MAKRKSVNVEVIPEWLPGKAEPVQTEPYRVLGELLATVHRRIPEAGARVALVWRKGWNPDKDGRLKLGQARKASDLERELQGLTAYDFVVALNHKVWPELDDNQQRHLVDHELTHCEFVRKDGLVQKDERDRPVCRIRGHDVEEFTSCVDRYGYHVMASLEAFAAAVIRRARGEFLDPATGEIVGGAEGGVVLSPEGSVDE